MAKSTGKNHFWTDEETDFMLNQLKELNILKYMDGRKTRNADLFKKVAEQMDEGGFKRTPEQIRVRWKHVKQAYYNARKQNSTSGHSAVSCPHSDILEELLGRRPLSQAVEHGVDIGFGTPVSESVLNPEENMEDTAQEADESQLSERFSSPQPGTSTPNSDLPRPPSGRRRRQLSELDPFLQQMQQMQNAWMDQFQQSQEREERLVQSILQSNASVVSALMEGIRSLQHSMPPTPSQVPPTPSQVLHQQMYPRYPAPEERGPVYHHM